MSSVTYQTGFTETTLSSLYAIAQVMKMDLETELYSLVRLLVYNRKAKILDVVRMVNVYTLPPIFPRP